MTDEWYGAERFHPVVCLWLHKANNYCMDENIQQTEPQYSHCWALYDTIRLPPIKDTDTLRVEEPEMTPKSNGTHGAL